MGTSATYTWESGTEGFTISGNGTEVYTFDDWQNPTKSTYPENYYPFEFQNNKWVYDVVQSINSYSVTSITSNKIKGLDTEDYLLLETYISDSLSTIFRGEQE